MLSQRLALVSCLFLSAATALATYDSYQDALDKYAKWHQRHGLPNRVERNVQKNVVSEAVFVPHRPRDGGTKFIISSPLTLSEFEKEVVGPNVFRNTRQPANYQLGVGGAEYVTSDGTPLYKVKRRYPLGYGRRKREAEEPAAVLRRSKRQWEILDPSTGRVKTDQRYQEQQNLDFYQQSLQSFPSQVRPERKTKRKTDAYITDSGEYLYRIKHRNPLGYSGRKRRQVSEAEQNILSRVPRKA